MLVTFIEHFTKLLGEGHMMIFHKKRWQELLITLALENGSAVLFKLFYFFSIFLLSELLSIFIFLFTSSTFGDAKENLLLKMTL